jgi:TonB family protein
MLVMIASTSTIAQAPQSLTDGVNRATTITVSEGQNHLLEARPPVYPPLAKAARIEGSVRLMLQVGATGAVVRVVPLSGHPLLIGAAIEAAKQYRYQPFEVNGAPADVDIEAVITFSRSDRTPSPSIPFPKVSDINTVVMEYDDGRIDIRISGSGLVDFNGTSGVIVEGKHQRRIQPQAIQQLLEVFRKADFFSLRDDYSVGATDVGRTTTSIQIDNSRKSIADDWVEVPPALKAIQDAILAVSDQWIRGNSDTVRSLLAEARSGTGGREILDEILPRAALYGDTATVRDILDTNVALERLGPYGATALLLAADRGLPDMVDALLKAGANSHAKDGYGRGALIFGAWSGNPEVVRLLLAHGLRGDEKDKYGDTALMAAAGAPETRNVYVYF